MVWKRRKKKEIEENGRKGGEGKEKDISLSMNEVGREGEKEDEDDNSKEDEEKNGEEVKMKKDWENRILGKKSFDGEKGREEEEEMIEEEKEEKDEECKSVEKEGRIKKIEGNERIGKEEDRKEDEGKGIGKWMLKIVKGRGNVVGYEGWRF